MNQSSEEQSEKTQPEKKQPIKPKKKPVDLGERGVLTRKSGFQLMR